MMPESRPSALSAAHLAADLIALTDGLADLVEHLGEVAARLALMAIACATQSKSLLCMRSAVVASASGADGRVAISFTTRASSSLMGESAVVRHRGEGCD